MKYFAIKHLPSGNYMPETGGGYSRWDCTDLSSAFSPRLFIKKRSAIIALNAWLQGIWGKERYKESEGWEYPSYWATSEPLVVAQPEIPRIKSEMSIVTLELTEDGQSN